ILLRARRAFLHERAELPRDPGAVRLRRACPTSAPWSWAFGKEARSSTMGGAAADPKDIVPRCGRDGRVRSMRSPRSFPLRLFATMSLMSLLAAASPARADASAADKAAAEALF